MIDMSCCTRCQGVIIGETKIHVEMCDRTTRLGEAIAYFEEEGIETLTIAQVKTLGDFLIHSPLSGDLLARYVLDEFTEF